MGHRKFPTQPEMILVIFKLACDTVLEGLGLFRRFLQLYYCKIQIFNLS